MPAALRGIKRGGETPKARGFLGMERFSVAVADHVVADLTQADEQGRAAQYGSDDALVLLGKCLADRSSLVD
ncbi:hypothetical protein [Rhizobium leguminosarum]|uniref:hypothetical protein n=1 Tax=Rhizobium leguminosarum TaxID=384 RepID=UPI0010303A95|nr:hypothetical protein [Rhizobium leguminosarum]TAY87951.1 hypothetical protein ELH83_09050 [Rhizobium leguminosarum]